MQTFDGLFPFIQLSPHPSPLEPALSNSSFTIPLQIKCGDLYDDKAVQMFNACAVSEKKCVPQRVDKDAYPVRPGFSKILKIYLIH